MKLKYITCSDPREFNDIHEIVRLGKISPRVEIAVQAHPSKMSYGMPRNEWFNELLKYVIQDQIDMNLAVHVNCEWCDEICRTGDIPQELRPFFHERKFANWPVIKRWQLNMPKSTAKNINVRALKKFFDIYYEHDFIVQYNDNTQDAVRKLHDAHARFSILYDASGGRGIMPTAWAAPVYNNVSQGYSGGLSPENIEDNLNKIATVATKPSAQYDKDNHVQYAWVERSDIWIDAEGKLKKDDKFDIARARQYIVNAENWLAKQR